MCSDESLSACAVGANHRRDRIWIVAHTEEFGKRESEHETNTITVGGQARHVFSNSSSNVSHPQKPGLEGSERTGATCPERLPAQLYRWWKIVAPFCRVADGIPARVDRLKCLGNAIVPQVAYILLKAIKEIAEKPK